MPDPKGTPRPPNAGRRAGTPNRRTIGRAKIDAMAALGLTNATGIGPGMAYDLQWQMVRQIAGWIEKEQAKPKSIGAENTFSIDLFTFEAAQDALLPIIDKVWRHCESTGARGRTVTLKVKYTDFQQITRSRSLAAMIEERAALEQICLDLLRGQFPVAKGIRLLGVSLSTFIPSGAIDAEQLPLGI